MLLALRPRWALAAASAGRRPASGGWMGSTMPTQPALHPSTPSTRAASVPPPEVIRGRMEPMTSLLGSRPGLDEIAVVRVVVDVRLDERALGNQRPLGRPHVVERAAGQRAPHPLALELREHLGVGEHPRAPVQVAVHREPCQGAVDGDLVAVALGSVVYLGGHRGTLSGPRPPAGLQL